MAGERDGDLGRRGEGKEQSDCNACWHEKQFIRFTRYPEANPGLGLSVDVPGFIWVCGGMASGWARPGLLTGVVLEALERQAFLGAVELCSSWAPDRANLLTNSRDGAQRRRELLTSGGGTGSDLAGHPEQVRNRETDRDAKCSKQWRNVRGAELCVANS